MITLYKRNHSGSIQEWRIQLGQSNDTIFSAPQIQIAFGQLNGKIQTIKENVETGKQKRTPLQQAEFQMQSLIKGKKDEGYKSLEDLNINEKAIGTIFHPETKIAVTLEELLIKYLPKDTTDANGQIKPMLAQPIKNDKKDNWQRVTYPIAGEPKLDGVRCLMFNAKDLGMNLGFVTSISREGKSYDFGTTEIRKALVLLFKDNPDIILDGELYVHGMPQNQISGAMRTGKYNLDIHDLMEYHVYDIVDTKLPYHERKGKLQKLHEKYLSFKLVPVYILQDKTQVDSYELKCIEEGYEGIMLKPLNGLYEIGKRSYNNLKVKQFLDEEFEIIGYELGKRGSEDIVFILKTEDGKEFKAKPIGNRELKYKYYMDFMRDRERNLDSINSNSIIGKKATTKFKFYSEYGIPNHAQVKDVRDYE